MRKILRYLPGIALVVASIAILAYAMMVPSSCSCPSQMPGQPPVCDCPDIAGHNPIYIFVGVIFLAAGVAGLLIVAVASRRAHGNRPNAVG